VVAKVARSAHRQRWDVRATRDERRDEILRSLSSVMRTNRLGSLTMRDIADQLGLVKGNLYYYFKNKQEILYHCHVKCIELSLAALAEVQAAEGAASERMRILLIRHISAITDDAYGGVLLTDLENMTKSQRKRYVELRDRFENGVRALIAEGISTGEFCVKDLKMAGYVVLGAINWIPKWFRNDGTYTSAEIAEYFADQLIGSLRS
jgi:AcrR family transcriptional regulator